MDDNRDFLVGKLLVATPNLRDSRFSRAVVLVCAHDGRHAMGLTVNKPRPRLEMGDLLDSLDIDARPGVAGEPVFYGGPCQEDRGLVVHSLDYRLKDTAAVTPTVGVTGSRQILKDIAAASPGGRRPARFLFAVGYAGWGAGQLESEIAANAWAFADARDDLIFADDPSQTWRSAMKSIGVTEAMFSAAWSEVGAVPRTVN